MISAASSFCNASSSDLHSLNNSSEITSAIYSFVNTMNNFSGVSDWVYGDTGEQRRPVYQTDVITQPEEPDADSSGASTPRLQVDDGEDGVFFVCSKCNALCDSYTESAPSPSTESTTICFSCWQSMVNERVDQLEDSEFYLP